MELWLTEMLLEVPLVKVLMQQVQYQLYHLRGALLLYEKMSVVEWSTFDGKSTHAEERDVLTVYSQLTILQFLFSEASLLI